VPLDYLTEYVRQLLGNVVAAGGRLIVGAYGSRTRHEPAFDVMGSMKNAGFSVAGSLGRVFTNADCERREQRQPTKRGGGFTGAVRRASKAASSLTRV